MTIAVWAASIFVALVMLLSGLAKLFVPRPSLATRMKWAASWSNSHVKLLGLADVLGAIGVIAPAATGVLPVLTPIAALCIAALMCGAVKVQLDHREPVAPAVMVGLLSVGIAVARLG